jgi:hypothetical protein
MIRPVPVMDASTSSPVIVEDSPQVSADIHITESLDKHDMDKVHIEIKEIENSPPEPMDVDVKEMKADEASASQAEPEVVEQENIATLQEDPLTIRIYFIQAGHLVDMLDRGNLFLKVDEEAFRIFEGDSEKGHVRCFD